MSDWRCPYCNGPVSTAGAPEDAERICPHCGRPFAEAVNAAADTVPAELADQGAPRGARQPVRPVFAGRTFVFELRGGGGNDGCGCLACGCLLLLLLLAGLTIRGCFGLF